jgi:uncharacterized protein (TIGR00369 family)
MNDDAPRAPDPARRVRDGAAATPLLVTMGAVVESVAPGRCTLSAPIDPRFTQQHGFLHAGAVTTLLDNAAGFAALSLMPEGSDVLSVEFKVNLLAPTAGTRVEAVGEVLRAGRTLSTVRADLFAIAGEVRTHTATFLGTMIRRAG